MAAALETSGGLAGWASTPVAASPVAIDEPRDRRGRGRFVGALLVSGLLYGFHDFRLRTNVFHDFRPRTEIDF